MHHRVRWLFGVTLAVGLSLGMSKTCQATLIFTLGNHPQASQENILFGAKETGNPVAGATNKTKISTEFSTTASYLLTQNSKGQADVEGLVKNREVNLTNITITPAVHVREMILNPHNATRGTTAVVTVHGIDASGHPEIDTFSYQIGNGNNFLTILAKNAELITSVTVDTGKTGSFNDLRQPRISGAGPAVVPEPTTLTLAGIGTIGLIGLGLCKRRHRAV